MAKPFHLTIARVGENLFNGEAVKVVLPGVDGVFTVMSLHEPFVSELKEGQALVEDTEGKTHTIHIHNKGIAEISYNQATVLL